MQDKDFLGANLRKNLRLTYFCIMRPDIYYFNPTCELAVANGSTNYMAPAKLRRFENELSTLPALLAGPADFVITESHPAPQFKDLSEKAGFANPHYQSARNLLEDPKFLATEKGFIFPWGWSPAAHKHLSFIKSECCDEFRKSPVAQWREIHRELYSRKTSRAILIQLVESRNLTNCIDNNDMPEICFNPEQIITLQQRWGKVVVKAPWSSSGRGLQFLRPGEFNRTNKQIITGFISQQGFVIVEPWHDKQLDLSFQFFSDGKGGIEYKGFTTFSTDPSGRYTGNTIQEFPTDLEQSLKEFLLEKISVVRNILLEELIASDYSTEYYGWLGVDAMIFNSKEGLLKFHPCLEINCRFTMGAIALKLREHLCEGSVGVFRILNGKEGDFNQYCRENQIKEPLRMNHEKIESGFLPLTPMDPFSTFGAYFKIMKL